jgi:hypothetical protein
MLLAMNLVSVPTFDSCQTSITSIPRFTSNPRVFFEGWIFASCWTASGFCSPIERARGGEESERKKERAYKNQRVLSPVDNTAFKSVQKISNVVLQENFLVCMISYSKWLVGCDRQQTESLIGEVVCRVDPKAEIIRELALSQFSDG